MTIRWKSRWIFEIHIEVVGIKAAITGVDQAVSGGCATCVANPQTKVWLNTLPNDASAIAFVQMVAPRSE